MRAAVYHGAKDVRVQDVPEPGDPGPGEVLLKVLRAGLCGTDSAEYLLGPTTIPLFHRHHASGHLGPVVLGHEFLARVVSVGSGVDPQLIGQRVVPGAGVYCRDCDWCQSGRPNLCARYYTLGLQANGGLAELVRAPATICVPVPDGCTDDAAAMAQPLSVALHALDRAGLSPSETLAVFGAGGIGGFLIAGAAARGCTSITAIDIAAAQLDSAGRLGATHTLNARDDDVLESIRAATDGRGVHVAAEASGAAGALATAIAATERGGRTLLVGIPKTDTPVNTADVTLRELTLIGTVAHICDTNLPEALNILTDHPQLSTVVDRVIDLDQLVGDGLEPLANGEVVGKVLVRP
jgi:(R,R)-butanediol dehydrogenase/meso-butanediol dehydrogenase/diacetyl reductase